MSNIVPAMNSIFVKGLRCPGTNLAQKIVAEDFLTNCARDLKLGISFAPFSKVCEPSYPGYNGIAANVLLNTGGYIIVATFISLGEVWINFAPVMSESQRREAILTLAFQIISHFGTNHFQMELGAMTLEQLAKRNACLLGMRYA